MLTISPTYKITWEKLPDNFLLPDDPVDNINQPALAAALTERAGIIAVAMTVKASLNIVVGGGFIDIWVGRFIFRLTRPYSCLIGSWAIVIPCRTYAKNPFLGK